MNISPRLLLKNVLVKGLYVNNNVCNIDNKGIRHDWTLNGITFFTGLFSIDPLTAEIKTRRDLTGRGRTDPYRLLVGATDGGGHTGDTSLSLYIGDVSENDGVPRFIRPAAGEILSVSEVGSYVLKYFLLLILILFFDNSNGLDISVMQIGFLMFLR